MLGVGRATKYIVESIADRNKKAFGNNIEQIINGLPKEKAVSFDMCSFSGSNYFYDQLLSIFSFYYNVGIPCLWNVYNDGTYTDSQIHVLQSIPNVTVKNFELVGDDIFFSKAVKRYPTLKKVFIAKQLVVSRPTIFVDSDIVFYPSFKKYIHQFNKDNWYIVDWGSGYFDKDYMLENPLITDPLNLGMLVFNEQPNWDTVIAYLKKKINTNDLGYWSDQTACYIMMSKSPICHSLPYDIFPSGGSDGFSLGYSFDYKEIAIRHFVGPVRHKMWQRHWKKHLLSYS